MAYLFNFLAAIFLAFFTHDIYPALTPGATWPLLLFAGWYTLLWLASFFYDRRGHFRKVPLVLGLILFYLKELAVASAKVAYDVLTPTEHIHPGVLAYPVADKTDWEITLLANFITLTPGSLSIDISEDRTVLYIHEIFIDGGDLDKKKQEIQEGFEKRILKITR